mmetsp:Transcript_7025/g.10734  ORF Transcript_7025/g.10734 Transcript_7025/m.10734 type:complete len:91 (+) Transcript_7025:313-585(+)
MSVMLHILKFQRAFVHAGISEEGRAMFSVKNLFACVLRVCFVEFQISRQLGSSVEKIQRAGNFFECVLPFLSLFALQNRMSVSWSVRGFE